MDKEFLPNLKSNIMDELLVTEGMLFRDESAKLFYMEMKALVFNKFTELGAMSDDEFLEQLCVIEDWSEDTSNREQSKVTKYCTDNLSKITVLYAKHLFAKDGSTSTIKIRKPSMNVLLKGIYKRLLNSNYIKNKSFYSMDPLRQDFVFRESFRMSLAECIDIIEDSEDDEEPPSEMDLKTLDEIKPDDSISNYCGRTEISFAKPPLPPPVEKSVVEEKTLISTNSKAQTLISSYSKPKFVRKVHLEDTVQEMDTKQNDE